ncbi:MAG: hypothetical protein ABWZ91_14990 [Nocardioides sp.]|jgi:hypothetical protein
MNRPNVLGPAAVLAVAAPLLLAAPALADPPAEIDQSLLVPSTLDSSFAPFDCRMKPTGPVCTGERHIATDWEPIDLPCDVPVYGRTISDRYSTRYYDHDYLNYDRRVRLKDIDYLSTSPSGPATATITAKTRFKEPFAVPGDEASRTIITRGVPWDIRPRTGRAIFRAVGTLVEPPGEVGTFTGHTTVGGVTTTYDNAPLSQVLPDDAFVDYVCRAATGS